MRTRGWLTAVTASQWLVLSGCLELQLRHWLVIVWQLWLWVCLRWPFQFPLLSVVPSLVCPLLVAGLAVAALMLSLFGRVFPYGRRPFLAACPTVVFLCPAAPTVVQPLSNCSSRSDYCPSALQPLSSHSDRSGCCRLVVTVPNAFLLVAGPVRLASSHVAALFSRHYLGVLPASVLAAVRLYLTVVIWRSSVGFCFCLRVCSVLLAVCHHFLSSPSIFSISLLIYLSVLLYLCQRSIIARTTQHFMFIFAFIMIIILSLFVKNDLGGYGDDD